MADEASIQVSLQIQGSGNLQYRSYPNQFNADVSGNKGPSPGAFQASVDGTDVDLSELNQPALCRITNLDATNFVTVGIWDSSTSTFYPLMELLPGEFYVVRLSRILGGEIAGTGTSTTQTGNTLRIKANTAACNVVVEAFEA